VTSEASSARSYLIVHGWQGNDPGHWQTWLAERLVARGAHVSYPSLPDFDHPKLSEWLRVLREELDALSDRDVTVVCHSLGAVLWMQHAKEAKTRVHRCVLVAPPSEGAGVEELMEFLGVDTEPEAIAAAADETLLVCADNDPYCPEGAPRRYGDPLGITTIVIEGGAHLNIAAGYGEWPQIETWVVEGLGAHG